jgi:hypothetical protein
MLIRRTAASLISVAALGVGGVALAAPASAQPIFTGGLVNVNIEDVNVQIPIGVAVSVCGVSVAALAEVQPAYFECADTVVTQDLPVAFQP